MDIVILLHYDQYFGQLLNSVRGGMGGVGGIDGVGGMGSWDIVGGVQSFVPLT